MKKDSLDEILDLLGNESLEEIYDHYVDKYKDTPDPITPELDAKMERIFENSRKQHQRTLHKKKIRYIAAVAVLILGVSGFSITKTEAWQAAITNLKIAFSNSNPEPNDDSVSDSDNSDKLLQISDGIPYPPTPYGYTVNSVKAGDCRADILYTRTGHPDISYMVYSNDYSIFGQEAEQTDPDPIIVDINGVDGTIIANGDSRTVIWNTSNFIYKITGCADSEFLLNIARSVRLL